MRISSFCAFIFVALFCANCQTGFGEDRKFELRVTSLEYYTNVGPGTHGADPGDKSKISLDITAGTKITSGFKENRIEVERNKAKKLEDDIAHASIMGHGDYILLLSLREYNGLFNTAGFEGTENRGDVLLIITRDKNGEMTARFDPKKSTTDRVIIGENGIDCFVKWKVKPAGILFGYKLAFKLSQEVNGKMVPVAIKAK